MATILITGAKGFIGKNLLATLASTSHVVIPIDYEHTEDELVNGMTHADFIIHLAGVNRSKDPSDFAKGNVDFTAHLLKLMDRLHKSIPLLVTSSTQALLENPYGKSKKQMETLLFNWAALTHNKVFIYRLTNVFGKWCNPNYNSVVATFCYNIAHDLPITMTDPDKLLHLVYIDDVITSFISTLDKADTLETGYYEPNITHTLTLNDLATKLYAFNKNSSSLFMSSLESPLDKALYATYLSYLDPNALNYALHISQDNRGTLMEFIKSDSLGQIFISTTKPGITRGNHWHHTKTEKFLVLQGHATIRLRSILDTNTFTYEVNGTKPQVVDIPPGYTHNITNSGTDELITLFWASEIFDASKPDTYYEEV